MPNIIHRQDGNFMNFSSSNYFWTNHSQYKMKFYGLSPSRVRRVIKSPLRVEEGIAEGTIAVMQPASYKTKDGQRTWSQEIWAMYCLPDKQQKNSQRQSALSRRESAVRVISAWRYPGKTKPGQKLPQEIIQEIDEALNIN